MLGIFRIILYVKMKIFIAYCVILLPWPDFQPLFVLRKDRICKKTQSSLNMCNTIKSLWEVVRIVNTSKLVNNMYTDACSNCRCVSMYKAKKDQVKGRNVIRAIHHFAYQHNESCHKQYWINVDFVWQT